MFKKISKINKNKSVRKRNDSDGEEGPAQAEDVEETAYDKIMSVKKKRKLMTEIQSKRGIDVGQLVQGSTKEEQETEEIDGLVGSNDAIIEQKHREAMEAFIRENIGSHQDVKSNQKGTGITVIAETDGEHIETAERVKTKNDLYVELAMEASQMAGRDPSISVDEQEDLGAGGMMIAGTGIAEVMLPPGASDAMYTGRVFKPKRKDTSLPTRTVTTSIPPRFQTSANRGMDVLRDRDDAELLAHQDKLKGETSQHVHQLPEMDKPLEVSACTDRDRVGFAALRGKKTWNGHRVEKGKASDDRVYAKFVQKERQRMHKERK